MIKDLSVFIPLAVLAYVSLFWLIAYFIKNWSIIDIGWGPGFALITAVTLVITNHINIISLLISASVFLWAIRLSLHIGIRNIGKPEDFRYQNWRKKWTPYTELQGYLRVFILQGSIMTFNSVPVILAVLYSTESPGVIYHVPGLVLFILGFLIEVVSDAQLTRFRRDPAKKGKFIKTGLWKHSRHPNYLGEVFLWWGIGMYALPLPFGYLGLLSPLCMHLIIRYISIPVLEEKWQDRNDWLSIKKYIPVLFPWI